MEEDATSDMLFDGEVMIGDWVVAHYSERFMVKLRVYRGIQRLRLHH